MKQIDVFPRLLDAGATQATAEAEDEITFERAVAAHHLNTIGMGMVEAIANGGRTYTYEELSRDWSTTEMQRMLEAVLRDYVNYQEGWTCAVAWVGEYDTSQDLPYNDRNPAYRDPHQRIVVVAERVSLP